MTNIRAEAATAIANANAEMRSLTSNSVSFAHFFDFVYLMNRSN